MEFSKTVDNFLFFKLPKINIKRRMLKGNKHQFEARKYIRKV